MSDANLEFACSGCVPMCMCKCSGAGEFVRCIQRYIDLSIATCRLRLNWHWTPNKAPLYEQLADQQVTNNNRKRKKIDGKVFSFSC